MGGDTLTPAYITRGSFDFMIMREDFVPHVTARCRCCGVMGLWDSWDNNHTYGKRCPQCGSDNTEDVGGLI